MVLIVHTTVCVFLTGKCVATIRAPRGLRLPNPTKLLVLWVYQLGPLRMFTVHP